VIRTGRDVTQFRAAPNIHVLRRVAVLAAAAPSLRNLGTAPDPKISALTWDNC